MSGCCEDLDLASGSPNLLPSTRAQSTLGAWTLPIKSPRAGNLLLPHLPPLYPR